MDRQADKHMWSHVMHGLIQEAQLLQRCRAKTVLCLDPLFSSYKHFPLAKFWYNIHSGALYRWWKWNQNSSYRIREKSKNEIAIAPSANDLTTKKDYNGVGDIYSSTKHIELYSSMFFSMVSINDHKRFTLRVKLERHSDAETSAASLRAGYVCRTSPNLAPEVINSRRCA